MPFIDDTAQRDQDQNITAFKYAPEASFGEVYAASVGQVFDEASSISFLLNREAQRDRKKVVADLISQGRVDRDTYTDQLGRFDYDRLAKDIEDPNVRTDEQIREERNSMLESRRNYAEDVISRGSGMAQFLGAANAYVLDPISIATMPIATAAVAGKGLGVLGSALLTARNAVVVEASAELLIQSFVYEHKQDIGSPYSEQDAISNVAMAALGAGVLGLTTGGISGYIRKIRDTSSKLDSTTPEVEVAKESLERLEYSLKDVEPEMMASAQKLEDEFLVDLRSNLEANTQKSLSPDEVRTLQKEISNSNKQLNASGKALDPDAEAAIRSRIDLAEARLMANRNVDQAKADLANFDKGILPEASARRLNELKSEQLVKAESEYLNKLEQKRAEVQEPSVKPENFEKPGRVEPVAPPKAPGSTREREAMEQLGLGKEYDADIASYNSLENPTMVDEAGETINAKNFMSDIDEQLSGLDAVMVCTRG